MSLSPQPPPHNPLPDSLPIRPATGLQDLDATSAMQFEASPSKARAAALESHSWLIVTTWLSDLYAPAPVPVFERNGSTLKALQQLMHANVTAGQTRKFLYEAQLEELAMYQAEEGRSQQRSAAGLLKEIEDSLPPGGQDALDSLARASVLLGWTPNAHHSSVITTTAAAATTAPSTTFSSVSPVSDLGPLIVKLTHQLFTLDTDLRQLRASVTSLNQEITSTNHAIATLRANHASSRPERERMHSQTGQWTRDAKQVSLKLSEYRDRVAALERLCIDGPTVQDVAAKQDLVRRQARDVQDLEKKLSAFHGLPPDVEASRIEVRRAQAELDSWKKKRAELFESMASY